MPLTPPPAAPNTLDPATFAAKMDARLAWQDVNVAEMSALQIDVSAKQATASAAAITVSDGATAAQSAQVIAVQKAAEATVAAATATAAPSTNSTSTTSLTIDKNSKTLIIQTGKAIVVGMSVKVASTVSPTNWMAGDVTAYDANTGSLTVNVTATNGVGTVAAWTISLAGVPGVAPPIGYPIGSLRAMGGQLTNPLTTADGAVWLRSGSLALLSTYPQAIRSLFAVRGGGFLSNTGNKTFFVNGLFVRQTTLGIATSPDLFAWTTYMYPNGYADIGATSIAFAGSAWILHGSSNNAFVHTTIGFANFTKITLPDNINRVKTVNGVAFAFVVGTASYCYTSIDGVTWVQRPLPSAQQWTDVAFGAGTYVIVSSSTATAIATALATWVAGGTVTQSGSCSIAFGNANTFVVVSGSSSSYNYSTNAGASYTPATYPTSTSGANDICWTGSKFYVGSNQVAFATSSTGVTFVETASTSVGSQANQALAGSMYYCATDGAGKLIAGVGQQIFVSKDHSANFYKCGFTYSALGTLEPSAGSATLAVQPRFNTDYISLITKTGNSIATRVIASGIVNAGCIAYSGSAWVLTTQSGTTARRSMDGINWSSVTLVNSAVNNGESMNRLAALGTTFLSLQGTTSGSKSTDNGASWSLTTYPDTFTGLASNGVIAMAISNLNPSLYWTTTDGASWTQRNLPAKAANTAMLGFDGVRFLLVAANPLSASGYTLYSTTDAITWMAKDLPIDSDAPTGIASTATMGGLAVILNATSSGAILTRDGGMTWIYQHVTAGSNPSPTFSLTAQGYAFGGYVDSGNAWFDMSVDYCGLPFRLHAAPSSALSTFSRTTPTFFQRVA